MMILVSVPGISPRAEHQLEELRPQVEGLRAELAEHVMQQAGTDLLRQVLQRRPP